VELWDSGYKPRRKTHSDIQTYGDGAARRGAARRGAARLGVGGIFGQATRPRSHVNVLTNSNNTRANGSMHLGPIRTVAWSLRHHVRTLVSAE